MGDTGNKKRVDAQKNKAKIVKEILKDPLKTQREIAKETWLWKTTVQEHKKSLKTTKDDRIIGICDKDIDIVRLSQKEIERRLLDNEEKKKISARDISSIAKDSSARYTIFRWEITDESGWLKSIQDMTLEEKIRRLNELEDE